MKMRIYYFGELIKDTNNSDKKTEILEQTKLEFNSAQARKKTGMESIGEILQELDLNLDSFRPNRMQGARG